MLHGTYFYSFVVFLIFLTVGKGKAWVHGGKKVGSDRTGWRFSFKKKKNLKIFFGCDRSSLLLGLFFSSCSEQGLLFRSWAQASHCGGFACCGAQALGSAGFVSCSSKPLEHRLNGCGSWA